MRNLMGWTAFINSFGEILCFLNTGAERHQSADQQEDLIALQRQVVELQQERDKAFKEVSVAQQFSVDHGIFRVAIGTPTYESMYRIVLVPALYEI